MEARPLTSPCYSGHAGYPCGLYLSTPGAFDGCTVGLGKVVLKSSVPRVVLTGGERAAWLPGEVWSLEPGSHASASLLATDHSSWYPNTMFFSPIGL